MHANVEQTAPDAGDGDARREPLSALDFSLALARPHRALMAGITLVLLLETAASLSLPWLGGQLADRLLGDGGGLHLLAALTVFALLVQTGARILGRLGTARIGDEILLELRRRSFDHLQRLPLAEHDRLPRGDQLSLLTTDAQSVSGFLSSALPALLPSILTVIGALAALALLQPLLALLIALGVGISIIGLRFWWRAIHKRARAWMDARAHTLDLAEQSIEMLPVIKGEAREAHQLRLYIERAEDSLRHAAALRRAHAPLQPIVNLAALTGILSLLLIGAGSTATAPGELVTLLLYGVVIARPLGALADLAGQWNNVRGALGRITDMLKLPGETDPGTREAPKKLVRGIRFDSVTFGYDPDTPVLRDFSLEIAAGERVAITGANGCGKSTLVALLMRFYRPWRGRITMDGIDLDEFQRDPLRRAIALVPQNVWLFQGSIRDNIRLPRPDAPDDDVRRAAHMACADEFIEAMEDGYDARLGPRGSRISGGQQQRIALARALLQPTPVLILDEATSMFDDVGEQQLLERIQPALENRTLIMITHRPRLLELADRVIRMDG